MCSVIDAAKLKIICPSFTSFIYTACLAMHEKKYSFTHLHEYDKVNLKNSEIF